MSRWDDWAGHYTYTVVWRKARVTVECDSEAGNDGCIMLPMRVTVGEVDITELVNIDDGELQELCQTAHEGPIEQDPDLLPGGVDDL